MNIIRRNCIRLLREGAFDEHLPLEPMSAWKWNRVIDFARLHDIAPWVYEGIRRSAGDFFLTVDESQHLRWQEAVAEASSEQAEHDSDGLAEQEQRFCNPLLRRKLRRLLQQAEKDLPADGCQATTSFMLRLVGISRNLLTRGIHLRRLVELGIYLRTTRDTIDYGRIRSWIAQLHMKHTASLTASLLVCLFDFKADDIPFAEATSPKEAQRLVREFHSGSLLQRGCHSLRYLYLFPQESPFNLLYNILHSLSHVEE